MVFHIAGAGSGVLGLSMYHFPELSHLALPWEEKTRLVSTQCLNTFFKVVSGIHWKQLLVNSTSHPSMCLQLKCLTLWVPSPPPRLPEVRAGSMVHLTSDFAAGLSRRRGKGELESAFGVGAGSQLPNQLSCLLYGKF